MKLRLVAAPLAIAMALLVVPMPAVAQTTDEKDGKAMFAEGNKLFASGDYVGALERFQGAYVRTKNPKVMLNLGTTYRQLGRFAEAATTYDAYLKDPMADPAKREEVETALREVLVKVATLRIEVESDGARVTIDGREVGKTPGAIQARVDRGPHTIVAEDGKGAAMTAQVDVAAGEDRVVRLRRVAEPIAAPDTKPPSVATTAPAPQREGWPTSSYALIGAGAGLIGASGYFALRSRSEYDRAAAVKTDLDCSAKTVTGCQDYKREANDKGDANKFAAYGVGGLGVAAAAIGVYLGVKASSRRGTGFRVAPAAAPGVAGVSAEGAW